MGLETGSTPAQRPLMRLKRLYGEPPNGIIFGEIQYNSILIY